MKKFIIINNGLILFKKAPTLDDAVTYATNFCDHSYEVIVREFHEVGGYVRTNLAGINEQIVELRDSENHVCPDDEGVGDCSCNSYDLVRDELDKIF